MIAMNKDMPIGIDDFKEVITKNYYFVDKTDFIRQIIDKHSKVTLITRPRRFGKTLAMSMLDYFFSNNKGPKTRQLFHGLDIERADKKYMQEQGQYPVIFLSLKEIKNPSWQDWPRMLQFIRLYLSQLYAKYRYLAHSPCMDDAQSRIFDHIDRQMATEDEMAMSLANLMAMVQQYYQKPVILLIDEYDVPIQQAWECGYYQGCIGFMRQFLGAALKSNPSLNFAVLTGVLRVAKESIFSGLNNFKTCSLLDDNYSNIFGFTADEIQAMFHELHLDDKLSEAQSWYDGYRIGGYEIYNPWSVLNYIDNHCQPRAYWVRTSGNGILRALMRGADTLQISMLQQLLKGDSIRLTLNESIIYPEIGQDKSALFTMLLTTGYLTISRVIAAEDDRYALRIPNKEILKLYSTEILNNMTTENSRNPFDNLFDFLLEGNAEFFSMQLQEILTRYISVYDSANKESFYHGFILGMTALFLGQNYIIESNRESGYGRFDLAIFPKDTTQSGVILEFKAADSAEHLQAKAEEALQQIESRQYITEFAKRGIQKVWKYGIAFYQKQVCVVRNDNCK